MRTRLFLDEELVRGSVYMCQYITVVLSSMEMTMTLFKQKIISRTMYYSLLFMTIIKFKYSGRKLGEEEYKNEG